MKTKFFALLAAAVFMTATAFGSVETALQTALTTTATALNEAEQAVTTPQPDIPMINCSGRIPMGWGSATPIVGFGIYGDKPLDVLIRCGGPSLAKFQVVPYADPILTLYKIEGGTATVIARNDNWHDWSEPLTPWFDRTGAYHYADGSKDAAMRLSLEPGLYTAIVTGSVPIAPNAEVLLELYAPDATATSGFSNLSLRGYIGNGGSIIFGFVTKGIGSIGTIIRGDGPSLATFGVTDCLPDPQIVVCNSRGFPIIKNDDWKDGAGTANMHAVGAYPYPSFDSKDAALQQGFGSQFDMTWNYTAVVSDTQGRSGNALVEIYKVF